MMSNSIVAHSSASDTATRRLTMMPGRHGAGAFGCQGKGGRGLSR